MCVAGIKLSIAGIPSLEKDVSSSVTTISLAQKAHYGQACRAFPRSRFPDDGKDLSASYGKRDTFDGIDLFVMVLK